MEKETRRKLSPEQRRLRREKSRAERFRYLLAHTDVETANYFLKVWEENVGIDTEKKAKSFRKENSEKIFANDARNKLTEYGNKVALDTLLSIPQVERVCTFAKFDLEELKARLSKGFVSVEQKQYFISERSRWFSHLKEVMRDYRISKETLESFGLNWKQCKLFAFQTV